MSRPSRFLIAAVSSCTLAALATWSVHAVAKKPGVNSAGEQSTSTSLGPGLPSLISYIPEQNRAIYLGYKGHVDTEVVEATP